MSVLYLVLLHQFVFLISILSLLLSYHLHELHNKEQNIVLIFRCQMVYGIWFDLLSVKLLNLFSSQKKAEHHLDQMNFN